MHELAAALRAEVAELAGVAPERLAECVRTDLRRAMAAIAVAAPPGAEELAESAAIAAAFARSGVSIDAVFHARRVAVRRGSELLREAAGDYGLEPEEQVELVHRMWEWVDSIQPGEAEAYRAAELELTGGGAEGRAWFVRALLHGSLAPAEVVRRATAYGLLPGATYLPFRARPAPGADVRGLAHAIEASGGNDGFGVLIATVDGDLCGAVSRPPRVPGGVVGLGPEAELTRLQSAFELANRAFETSLAFGHEGVVTVDELSLRPAILSEVHLGERLVRRHLEPLHALGEFGETLEQSVREYLGHGMRIDESARVLHVHPNTLRHRLDRFQQLTGADLRRTEDVLELWWALERRRLDARPAGSGQ